MGEFARPARQLLVALAAMAVMPLASAADSSAPVTVTDSDAAADAGAWTYFWGDGGAVGSAAVRDPTDERNGVVSLKLSVSKDNGYVAAVYRSELPEGTRQLKLRLDANGFPGVFALRLRDRTGETHQYPLALPGGSRGWKELTVDLNRPHVHWGGANSGVIAFPASLGLQFNPGLAIEGSVLVDTVVATVEITEDNRYRLTEVFPVPGNLWFSERAAFGFRFEDRLEAADPRTAAVEVLDDRGEVVLSERRPLKSAAIDVPFAAGRYGLYRATVTVRDASGAVLRRVDTTGARVRSAKDVPAAAGLGMNLSTATRASGDRAAYAKLAYDCGVRWTRDEFSWERIEPRKGQFNWKDTDDGVNAERAAGLKILGLLAYSASWARRDPGRFTSPPKNVEDYANFVYAVVSRYRDRVHHWELWNEPDSPVFWPPNPQVGEFAALVEAGVRAAKRADPTCTVMPAGLLVGMNHVDNWRYLEDLMKFPCGKLVDVVAWHAYCDPLSPEKGKYAERTRMLSERSLGKRLWLTEQGWPTAKRPDGTRLPAAAQRDYLVRAHVLALSDPAVDTFFWFLFRDGQDRDHDYEQSYGLLNPDLTPKPSFPAYVTMTGLIGGAKPLGVRQLDGKIVRAAFARADGGEVAVCWCPTGTAEVPLATLDARPGVRAVDSCGNALPTGAGRTLALSGAPVYLISK